jgi:hypothetical protein
MPEWNSLPCSPQLGRTASQQHAVQATDRAKCFQKDEMAKDTPAPRIFVTLQISYRSSCGKLWSSESRVVCIFAGLSAWRRSNMIS